MSRAKYGGRQRSTLGWALAAGAVTAVSVLTLYSWAETREETRETVSGLYVRVAQHENSGSDIDVTSTHRVRKTLYQVSGTMTHGDAGPVDFDCMAYSDLHGGWGAEMGDEVTPK